MDMRVYLALRFSSHYEILWFARLSFLRFARSTILRHMRSERSMPKMWYMIAYGTAPTQTGLMYAKKRTLGEVTNRSTKSAAGG